MKRKMGKAGVFPLGPSKNLPCDNRPLFDKQGRCHGTITEGVRKPARVLSDGREISEGICWLIRCDGTLYPKEYPYWTGVKLTKRSKLLGLWNKLGLSEDSTEVDRAIGLPVVFKLAREGGEYRVEPGSITLDLERDVQLSLV